MRSSRHTRTEAGNAFRVASLVKETGDGLGCLVYREDLHQLTFFPKTGEFDECQIDKSGRWLLIKEQVDDLQGVDNVIVDLQTGTQKVLLDEDGAGGHSDNGFGYMVAADNWYTRPMRTGCGSSPTTPWWERWSTPGATGPSTPPDT